MHRITPLAALVAATALTSAAGAAGAQDTARTVADGGVHVAGWTGRVDANEERAGQTLANARLAGTPDSLHARTGPAVAYWHPDNRASGDYTVRATFREPAYMALNNHPHPYGVFIGGSGMGTADQRYLYCAAYGNGNFIVRGFGPAPFQLNGRRGEANDAVRKAAGPGESVTQEIALGVKGDRVECTINGTVVASYPKADVLGDGKLASTDGVYGIRLGHNTEAVVTGLSASDR